MSFFDEVDEPPTPPRTQTRRRRPSGTGRRPPSGQQSIQARRGVAAVVLLVIVILIALGVHSCQVSARNSAMRSYTNSVSSIITASNQTGSQLFGILSSGISSSSGTSVYNSITQTLSRARTELTQTENLSVPDQLKSANQDLLLAMHMRVDGIANIAQEIQPALGSATSKDAVYALAAEIARLYSSDVVYLDYATHEIAAALHGAGIAVGGSSGESIAGGHFVPDVQWLQPTFIASYLHVTLPNSRGGKFVPGLHGHALNSVSVAGTTLQTGSANAIPASPAPTFLLSFTNGGDFNETNVVCKVTVSGTTVAGQATVSETFAHKPATCSVKLSTSPASGTATVVATVEPVPGEKNTANNSLSFPVTFQ